MILGLSYVLPTLTYLYIDRRARIQLYRDVKKGLRQTIRIEEGEIANNKHAEMLSAIAPGFRDFTFSAPLAVIISNALIISIIGSFVLGSASLIIGLIYLTSSFRLANSSDTYDRLIGRDLAWLGFLNVIFQAFSIILLHVQYISEITVYSIYYGLTILVAIIWAKRSPPGMYTYWK